MRRRKPSRHRRSGSSMRTGRDSPSDAVETALRLVRNAICQRFPRDLMAIDALSVAFSKPPTFDPIEIEVNAVKLPWERRSRTQATADKLAEAVALDMTGFWWPT